ncbi:MAG: hypothetical protein WBA74_20955 [Cyclobacteriaceae bacterium]
MTPLPGISWKSIKITEPEAFLENLQQLHHAVQHVAAMDYAFSKEPDGNKVIKLSWCTEIGRVTGQLIEGAISFKALFLPKEFTIALEDKEGNLLTSLPLEGQKQGKILVWLEEQADQLGLDTSAFSLNLPYEIPDYLLGKRKPFKPKAIIQETIVDLFNNACLVLQEAAATLLGFDALSIFPKHLYLETQHTVKDTGDPETSACVRLGMSPGDDIVQEPYYYVNVLPFPSTEDFPGLTNGIWYEDEWVGAIYSLSAINAKTSEVAQRNSIVVFLQEACEVLRATIK